MIEKCVPDVLVFPQQTANPAVEFKTLKQSEVMKRLLKCVRGLLSTGR